MWSTIAKEMSISWHEAELMHWRMGRERMISRAVTTASLKAAGTAPSVMSAQRTSCSPVSAESYALHATTYETTGQTISATAYDAIRDCYMKNDN